MRFKFLNSVLVSVGMIAAAPVAAAPATAPAAKLSVVQARAGAPVEGEKLAAGAGVIALVILAGIAAIAVLAATADDEPQSA